MKFRNVSWYVIKGEPWQFSRLAELGRLLIVFRRKLKNSQRMPEHLTIHFYIHSCSVVFCRLVAGLSINFWDRVEVLRTKFYSEIVPNKIKFTVVVIIIVLL